MQHLIRLVSLLLAAIFLIHILSTSGQGEQKKVVWKGRRADRTTITAEDLSKILEEHKRWIETDRKQGQPCDLSGAILSGANLR